MQTLTRHYPDGTHATYRLAPGSDAAAALLMPMKLPRTRWARTEKRTFPKYYPGQTSTADYVSQYFQLNAGGRHGSPCAYGKHLDHMTLYAPLPDAPAAVYMGVDSVEPWTDEPIPALYPDPIP